MRFLPFEVVGYYMEVTQVRKDTVESFGHFITLPSIYEASSGTNRAVASLVTSSPT